MAYRPDSAVNAIYKLKQEWSEADSAGNTDKKNEAAKRAQEYYNQLKSNGYADTANELSASNLTRAKTVRDKVAKLGKTYANDYMYTLGKSRGMTAAEVDNLIGYDADTNEMTFGGKKIGSPDATIDGKMYVNDDSLSKLDEAFSDYVTRSGNTMTNAQAAKVNTGKVNSYTDELWNMQKEDRTKYNTEYDKTSDFIGGNPTESAEYTSAYDKIMPEYKLKAMEVRDNEYAEGAADNSGNVDSFAAANAARQQAAITAQGQSLAHQAGLESWQTKATNALNLLSNLSGTQATQQSGMQNTINLLSNEAQRNFENGETEKSNKVANLATEASVTGYTPQEWTLKNDGFYGRFVDDEGNLKPEFYNVDFQALINNAKANGNSELAKKYAVLRGLKIFGDYKNYGKYLKEGDVAYTDRQKTEEGRQFDKQMDYNYAVIDAEKEAKDKEMDYNYAALDAEKEIAQMSSTGKKTTSGTSSTAGSTMTYAQAEKAIKNGELSDGALSVYNDYNGTSYTKDNPPPIYTPSTGDGAGLPSTSEGDDTEWNAFLEYFDADKEKKTIEFLNSYLKPWYDRGEKINENVLEDIIVGNDVKNSNSTQYDIDVEDARKISNALGLDDSWVDKYKNRWGFNSGKGMKSAK